MQRPHVVLLAVAVIFLVGAATHAQTAAVERQAPDFTLPDVNGTKHSLSDFKGKFVVLEWVNYDCPFVRKHYESGNMQELQKASVDSGAIWLSICSSAAGKQGYFETAELNKRIKKEGAVPTAYLVDAEGTVGRLYGAKATPHMYVISPEGALLYAGAIDDIRSTDVDDVPKATNYVRAALGAAMSGKAVQVKSTNAYGCSVKYK